MVAKSIKGQRTRLRILKAAADLMQTRGVNGTSVDDVLSSSKTGKSQFYHYFDSKDQLVKEVLHYRTAALSATNDPLMKNLNSLEGVETWLEYIETQFERGLFKFGCPVGNLANEMASQNEALRLEVQAIFTKWETALESGLKAMRAEGILRPTVEPAVIASYVIASIEGGLLLAKTERSVEPLRSTLTCLASHLRMLATGGARTKKTKEVSYCP